MRDENEEENNKKTKIKQQAAVIQQGSVETKLEIKEEKTSLKVEAQKDESTETEKNAHDQLLQESGSFISNLMKEIKKVIKMQEDLKASLFIIANRHSKKYTELKTEFEKNEGKLSETSVEEVKKLSEDVKNDTNDLKNQAANLQSNTSTPPKQQSNQTLPLEPPIAEALKEKTREDLKTAVDQGDVNKADEVIKYKKEVETNPEERQKFSESVGAQQMQKDSAEIKANTL